MLKYTIKPNKMSREEAKIIFDEIDKNKNGELDSVELKKGLLKISGSKLSKQDIETLV